MLVLYTDLYKSICTKNRNDEDKNKCEYKYGDTYGHLG